MQTSRILLNGIVLPPEQLDCKWYFLLHICFDIRSPSREEVPFIDCFFCLYFLFLFLIPALRMLVTVICPVSFSFFFFFYHLKSALHPQVALQLFHKQTLTYLFDRYIYLLLLRLTEVSIYTTFFTTPCQIRGEYRLSLVLRSSEFFPTLLYNI